MENTNMKGLFITFEGNDGSGKSSVIAGIKTELEKLGYDVLLTREPGGSYIAEKIRTVILDPDNKEMDPKTEALLYAASRREHMVHTVLPALEEGKIVISDRFVDSSIVYQGIARGLGEKEVFELNQYAIDGKLPDLTIVVTVRPEVGMERIKNNRHEFDRLELEKIEFHHVVYNGYQKLKDLFPNRVKMVNGEQTKEEVLAEAKGILKEFLQNNR